MSTLVGSVVQWENNVDGPLREIDQVVTVSIIPECRLIELGADLVRMKDGRVYLRFDPEKLMAALAAAMFDRDE